MFVTYISMTALRDVSDIHFNDSIKGCLWHTFQWQSLGMFLTYISMTAFRDVSDIHFNDSIKGCLWHTFQWQPLGMFLTYISMTAFMSVSCIYINDSFKWKCFWHTFPHFNHNLKGWFWHSYQWHLGIMFLVRQPLGMFSHSLWVCPDHKPYKREDA